MNILLGFTGFLLYFLYDINSLTWKTPILQKGFLLGTCLVAAATVRMILGQAKEGLRLDMKTSFFAAAALLFFLLLIYTLFFALPFKETYMEDGGKRPAYTEGVYALCRHPGVLWFAGAYGCLAAMTGSREGWLFALFLTGFNVCYVAVQDLWTFPGTFSNYQEYKRTTPFLLPNRKSVRDCLAAWSKR